MNQTQYYAIMGYFKACNKWLYFGSPIQNDSDWTLFPGEIHFLLNEEQVEHAYKAILNKYSRSIRGSGRILDLNNLPDKIKVVEIILSISDTNIISEDRLKEERQKSALNKLTRQEIEDLDLEHLAVLHKLSDDTLEDDEEELPF